MSTALPTAQLRSYRRPFARPLNAAWGRWSVREGVLLCLQDPETGRRGFGEAAPLPGPLEATQQAAAMEFARWSAEQALKGGPYGEASVGSAALLSLGAGSPDQLLSLRAAGFHTFKVKLGVDEPAAEWMSLQALAIALRGGERLRLDPNRAWSSRLWGFWQPRLTGLSERVEFLEEPFVEAEFSDREILSMAERSKVPMALDESLHSGQLTDWVARHWPGYWVIKPSLMGHPDRWQDLLANRAGRVVLSSAFETGIGLSALVRLATAFPGVDHGLGTQAFFNDDLGLPESGSRLRALRPEEAEAIWNRLGN